MPLNALLAQEIRIASETEAAIADAECLADEKCPLKPIVRAEQEHLALLEWERPEPPKELCDAAPLRHIAPVSGRSGWGLYDCAVILLMIASLAATAACFMRIIH